MAEVITRFRVNVNGVEQDARVCYQNLANKPTFKTINGKAIIVSSGDTETNFDVATQTDFTALANRVTNLEQNGTSGGGGSGTPYDDTEVRNLITAEQNRATTKEASLEAAIDEVKQTQQTQTADFNGFTNYAENSYAKVGDLGNVVTNLNVTNNAVENLEARVETLENSSGSSSGSGESSSVDLSNYYKKTETYSQEEVDDKLAKKLDNSMFQDFAASVESTYSTKTDFNNLEARVEDLEASSGSYTYERITETINLSADSAEGNCQTLYVKLENELAEGGTALLGVFSDNYEVYLLQGGIVEISGVNQYNCELIETGVYSFALPAVMAGAYIEPDTDTSNTIYFVERKEVSTTQVQLGKTLAFASLERENVELDINKVYELDLSRFDNDVYFVLTDNGNALELNKVYTLKLLYLYIDDAAFGSTDNRNNIPSKFKAKISTGLTERGVSIRRTFVYSEENDEIYSFSGGNLPTGFYINGSTEISFYCDEEQDNLKMEFSPCSVGEQ